MLTEKRTKNGRAYYENEKGVIVEITCTKCKQIKKVDEFDKHKSTFAGLNPRCKKCRQDYYKRNRGRELVRKREYREANKTKSRLYYREWLLRNRDKRRVSDSKREAMKRNLPSTLTDEELREILDIFNNKCALTGSDDYHLDHVVPISTGYGGTTKSNIIPLRRDLNLSKGGKCLFEWFEECGERFSLSEEKFTELIEYLSDVNNMTVAEYEMYVRGCHER